MTALRNVWALVEKEWRHYFGEPHRLRALTIWTLLGVVLLLRHLLELPAVLVRHPRQQAEFGVDRSSLNDMVITRVLQNMSVVALFMTPMLTMRLFAEEKRQGTIELLATSPLTDLQIMLGKFFGRRRPLRADGRWPGFVNFAAPLGTTLRRRRSGSRWPPALLAPAPARLRCFIAWASSSPP